MTKKLFNFTAASLLAVAGLASCSQADEPEMNVVNPSDSESIEWTLEMDLPDMPKTRAAGQGVQGNDGLYKFEREINRLWYAVYYNDQWIYDCTTPESQQAVKIGDNFSLVFKLPKLYDPTKVKLFFWAGNADDKVTTDNVTSVSDGINLNFKERCVSLSPKYLNGDNISIAEYDSFCGYFQLAPTTNVTNFNLKFTLKRPFAQIHILSDEFTDPLTRDAYPQGFIATPGFGRDRMGASASNVANELVTPTTWFYDNSISLNPAYKQGEYMYTQTNYEYTNNLVNAWPTRTTFKGRDFHYVGCYLTFAPTDGVVKGAAATGNQSNYNYLNVAFRKPGEGLGQALFKRIKFPSDGIRANNRYIVYNHKTNPGDGGQSTDPNDPDPDPSGGGDLVNDVYGFEISADTGWNGTTDDIY